MSSSPHHHLPLQSFLPTSFKQKPVLNQGDEPKPECLSKTISDEDDDTKPQQGFDRSGKIYNIFQCSEYYRLVLHRLECFEDGAKLKLHDKTVNIKPVADVKPVKNFLYDPESNSCFFFKEPRYYDFDTADLKLDIFAAFFDTDEKDMELDFRQPNLRLEYSGVNLYKYYLVNGGEYIAIFANGYKYGFKSCHVHYDSDGFIDMISYDKQLKQLSHFSRIRIKAKNLDLGSLSFDKMFIGKSSQLFCYGYSTSDIVATIYECTSLNEQDVVNSYRIEDEESIRYFNYCRGSTFVYVTNESMTVKLVRLYKQQTQPLKEIPLRLSLEDEDLSFSSFSLFNRFGKLYLCMQGIDCVVHILDLLSDYRVFTLPLDHPVRSIQLNWNMEELACTRVDPDNCLSFDVYKISNADLSLQHIAKLAVLMLFSKKDLSKLRLPSNVKEHLDLL